MLGRARVLTFAPISHSEAGSGIPCYRLHCVHPITLDMVGTMGPWVSTGHGIRFSMETLAGSQDLRPAPNGATACPSLPSSASWCCSAVVAAPSWTGGFRSPIASLTRRHRETPDRPVKAPSGVFLYPGEARTPTSAYGHIRVLWTPCDQEVMM